MPSYITTLLNWSHNYHLTRSSDWLMPKAPHTNTSFSFCAAHSLQHTGQFKTMMANDCALTAFCCRLVFIHAHLFSCTLISINRNEGMPPVLVLKTSSTSMAVTLSLAIMTVLRASLERNRKQHKTRGSLLAGFLNNTTKKKAR